MERVRGIATQAVVAGTLGLLVISFPQAGQAMSFTQACRRAVDLLKTGRPGRNVPPGKAYRHMVTPNGSHLWRLNSSRLCWVLPRNAKAQAVMVQLHRDKRGYTARIEGASIKDGRIEHGRIEHGSIARGSIAHGSNGVSWAMVSARTPVVKVKGGGVEGLDAALEHFVGRLPVRDLVSYSALPQALARSQALLMRWLDRFVEPVGDSTISRDPVQQGLKKAQMARWEQMRDGGRLLVLPAGSVVRDPQSKSYGMLKRSVAGRPEPGESVITVQTRAPLHPLAWQFINPLPAVD